MSVEDLRGRQSARSVLALLGVATLVGTGCSTTAVPRSASACVESWNASEARSDLAPSGGGGARIFVGWEGRPGAIKVDGCQLIIRTDDRRCYIAGIWETTDGWVADETATGCYEGLSYPLTVDPDGTIGEP